ncbi:MAG: hypothetical protein K9M45_01900 [Kiritimatiellales bacterium]|nr:hypothetical protein [Kiritimatiellales bacterium]
MEGGQHHPQKTEPSQPAPAVTLPPPEKDELTVTELKAQLFNLDGKVIETEITSAIEFQQLAKGRYAAKCLYHDGSRNVHPSATGTMVLFNEEGRGFAEDMVKRDLWGSPRETVFLLVHSESPIRLERRQYKLEAVGKRFIKKTGIYKW